jgi:Zn-dependent alcohol dehydrogenase
MATTMTAAVAREFGKPLTIEELPVPNPGRGAVLVKIRATGVWQCDLHAADGDWPVKPTPPFIPGHAGAGIVAAMGSGVMNLKRAIRPVSPGYTAPAALANTALPGGKRCASFSMTAATASMAASPITRSRGHVLGQLKVGVIVGRGATDPLPLSQVATDHRRA